MTSTNPVSQELHNKQSANTIMKEFTDSYLNPFIEERMAELELEEEGSRNPDVKSIFFLNKKKILKKKAKNSTSHAVVIPKKLLQTNLQICPESGRNERDFLQADEWEADAFEEILDKNVSCDRRRLDQTWLAQ